MHFAISVCICGGYATPSVPAEATITSFDMLSHTHSPKYVYPTALTWRRRPRIRTGMLPLRGQLKNDLGGQTASEVNSDLSFLYRDLNYPHIHVVKLKFSCVTRWCHVGPTGFRCAQLCPAVTKCDLLLEAVTSWLQI